MKKLIFLLPLMFTFIAFSQTEKPITKGNMIISGGGTIQFNKINTTNGPDTQSLDIFEASFNPGIAYFFIDNLAIGLNTTFGYSKYNSYKSYSVGAGPFVKYYFNNGLFVKTDFSYTYLHGVGSNETKIKDYSIIPGVGYAFFLNQKVSLEPCLSYQYAHDNANETIAKMNGVLFELKLNIFL
jgi:hypothetical protein